jgi:hypothetical protein
MGESMAAISAATKAAYNDVPTAERLGGLRVATLVVG